VFKSPTLIVVGAGASCDALGLPTGEQLVGVIRDKLNIEYDFGTQMKGDRKIGDAIRLRAIELKLRTTEHLVGAGHEIRRTFNQAKSIDAVLENHHDNEEMVLVGKMAIVVSILEAERKTPLAASGKRFGTRYVDLSDSKLMKSWYRELTTSIFASVPKSDLGKIRLALSNLTFVIFNYDRCVEAYLFEAIHQHYGFGDEQIAELLSEVRFFHPYGSIGKLPWQKGLAMPLEIGAEISPAQLLKLAPDIQTYTERNHSGEFLEKLRLSVSLATNALFFGFAFHEQNMELITCSVGNLRKCYASAYGLSPHNCTKAIGLIRHAFASPISEQLAHFTGREDGCAVMFSEYSGTISG
jgi:hypothetical protein